MRREGEAGLAKKKLRQDIEKRKRRRSGKGKEETKEKKRIEGWPGREGGKESRRGGGT